MKLSMEVLQELKTTDSIARKNEIVKEIEIRASEIIESVIKKINLKDHWWAWKYYEGDNEPNFSIDENIFTDMLQYLLLPSYKSLLYENENGEVFDLACNLPINWLWDDFKEDLELGIKRYNKKEKDKKIKQKARREELKSLKSEYRKSAIKKLTPEELWATELSKKMPKSLKHFTEE